MLRKTSLSLLALTILLAMLFVPWPKRSTSGMGYNVLFLNTCSVNRNHLPLYGYHRNTTPNLARFSQNAFIFRNYIGNTSWRNFWASFYQSLMKDPSQMRRYSGFPAFANMPENPETRDFGPLFQSTFKYFEAPEWKKDELRDKLAPYKDRILGAERDTQRPFFLTLLIKLAHFPYSGANREEIDYSAFFSGESAELYKSYLKAREAPEPKYELLKQKLPLFALLFGDRALTAKSALSVLTSDAVPEDPIGLMNSPVFVEKWKASEHFDADVQLLKDVYDAKLRYLDSELRDLLFLYDNRSLQKNTIVIFAGDHGSALMEHGQLHNGNIPYDEIIRAPLIIKFPGIQGQHFFDGQVSEESLKRIVSGLLSGRLNAKNFESSLPQFIDPLIFSRDCSKSSYSARLQNEWKFIQNYATSSQELYDLRSDPSEKNNLIASRPDIAGMFEELMLRHQSALDEINAIPCPAPDPRRPPPASAN